jgi:transposase-like protein
MSEKSSGESRRKCPYLDCKEIGVKRGKEASPPFSHIVRKGAYYRTSDSKWVRRFFCDFCERSFSSSRRTPCFGQKKRTLNEEIRKLLYSGVSQRRIALHLQINRKTVVRKFLFLAKQAELEQKKYLKALALGPKLRSIQFDEMESFERSKCLPLSIPLVVEEKTRKILGFRVASMPAKGALASLSREKYGKRTNERPQKVHNLFCELLPLIDPHAQVTTDQNPHYPGWLKPHFPHIIHRTVKGKRGCITGQGELKKVGFDPLFDLNHTCAMFRANVNRLFRKTWCTTKKPDRLEAHLHLYVQAHNFTLT